MARRESHSRKRRHAAASDGDHAYIRADAINSDSLSSRAPRVSRSL